MNKSQLIEHIAKEAEISKAAATRALAALTGGVKSALKKGEAVSLGSFGTFSVSKELGLPSRNANTGVALKRKPGKVPKFRPGKGLRDSL